MYSEKKEKFKNLAERAYMLAEALGLDITVRSSDIEGSITLLGESLILNRTTTIDYFSTIEELLRAAQNVCFTNDPSYDDHPFKITLTYRLHI